MLQHELWIERLAERAGLQGDTGYSLWRAYVGYVRQRLQTSLPVYLPAIGLCLVEQSEAYIAELPSGERYIVPPRLGLCAQRLEMKTEPAERELLSLCDALTLECELGEGLLLTWLRNIEPLLIEWLEQGQIVYWEGMGELMGSLGESGGLSAFSWSLDPELSLIINKPFEVFHPIPLRNEALLAEGLCLRSLDSLDVLSLPQVISFSVFSTEEASECLEPLEHEVCDGLDSESASEDLESIEEVDIPNSGDPARQDSSPSTSEIEVPQQRAKEDETSREGQRGKLWGLITLLLIIFGGGIYFFYRADWHLPKSSVLQDMEVQDHVDSAQTEQVQMDLDVAPSQGEVAQVEGSLEIAESKSVATLLPVKEQAEIPKESKSKDAELASSIQRNDHQEVVELAPGQSLRALALRKYGDSIFWVYIYEENRELIKDPDKVPVGTKLVLPPSRKYGIDPKDTKARERALILQRSYSSIP